MSITEQYFDVINPFTRTVVGRVKNSSVEDVIQCIEFSAGYKCSLTADERSSILLKTAKHLQENKDSVAQLISLETGLSLVDTKYEVDRVVNCARYAAKVCELIERDITKDFVLDDLEGPELTVITEPLNLAVGITPFNHPMNQVGHKVFPAIAAGTPIIIKPSEKTPLSAIKLAEILYSMGLPEPMLQVVHNENPIEIVAALVSNPKVDLVSFTGGLKVGREIKKKMVSGGNYFKKYIPELGGCSSLIVCKDANLLKATEVIIKGIFKNSGQRCTCIRRVIVENEVADELRDLLITEISKITVGDPFDPQTQMGTLINEGAASIVEKRVKAAVADGAMLHCGGDRVGALFMPTLLDKVTLEMELVSEETFGPVCSLIRSASFEHSLELAKNTNYALAGGIITSDEEKAKYASAYLTVGQFSFNGPPSYRTEAAPFGGFGDSGSGEKEGVVMAARAMRRIRTYYRHDL